MTTTTSTWLDPIPGLWRYEAAHRHWLGDHLFPVSITGVLAHGLSDYAKRSIEAKRSIWEPRGTTVHAALEYYSQARFLGGRAPEKLCWTPRPCAGTTGTGTGSCRCCSCRFGTRWR